MPFVDHDNIIVDIDQPNNFTVRIGQCVNASFEIFVCGQEMDNCSRITIVLVGIPGTWLFLLIHLICAFCSI